MAEEMIVFARCYDLLAWLMPKAETFPRAFRFSVTQRLMDAALDLQEALFEAQSQRAAARLAALRAADAALASAAALPATRPPVALAQCRPVRARQRHCGRDRPPARRLAQADRQRIGRGASEPEAREAPLFSMCPTARPLRAIRADGTSLRHPSAPSPRPANRGRRAFPARPSRDAFSEGRMLDVGAHTPTRKPMLLLRLPGSLWLR